MKLEQLVNEIKYKYEFIPQNDFYVFDTNELLDYANCLYICLTEKNNEIHITDMSCTIEITKMFDEDIELICKKYDISFRGEIFKIVNSIEDIDKYIACMREIALINNELDEKSQIDDHSENFIVDNGVLLKYIGNHKNVKLPGIIRKVSHLAFSHNKDIESIDLSDVIEIEKNSFYGCSNLKKLKLPFIGCTLNDDTFFGELFGQYSYYNSRQISQIKDLGIIKQIISSYIPNSLETVIFFEGTPSKEQLEGFKHVTFKCKLKIYEPK